MSETGLYGADCAAGEEDGIEDTGRDEAAHLLAGAGGEDTFPWIRGTASSSSGPLRAINKSFASATLPSGLRSL